LTLDTSRADNPRMADLPPKPNYSPVVPPLPAAIDHPQDHFEGLRDALRAGLHRVHADIARTQQLELEQAAILQSVLRVLMSKGIVTAAELEGLYPLMHQTLSAHRAQTPTTAPKLSPAAHDPTEPDDLDCRAHHPVCGAACCSAFNVFLTPEEAAQGRYLWDVSAPYRILADAHGTCVYFDHAQLGCTIWQERPMSCRTFDCRTDGRVWDDYPARRLSTQSLEAKARLAASRRAARVDDDGAPPG